MKNFTKGFEKERATQKSPVANQSCMWVIREILAMDNNNSKTYAGMTTWSIGSFGLSLLVNPKYLPRTVDDIFTEQLLVNFPYFVETASTTSLETFYHKLRRMTHAIITASASISDPSERMRVCSVNPTGSMPCLTLIAPLAMRSAPPKSSPTFRCFNHTVKVGNYRTHNSLQNSSATL